VVRIFHIKSCARIFFYARGIWSPYWAFFGTPSNYRTFFFLLLFVPVFYFWGARFKINYPQNPKKTKKEQNPDEQNADRISAYRDPGASLEPITGARPKRAD
jgi:hypothetical protein